MIFKCWTDRVQILLFSFLFKDEPLNFILCVWQHHTTFQTFFMIIWNARVNPTFLNLLNRQKLQSAESVLQPIPKGHSFSEWNLGTESTELHWDATEQGNWKNWIKTGTTGIGVVFNEFEIWHGCRAACNKVDVQPHRVLYVILRMKISTAVNRLLLLRGVGYTTETTESTFLNPVKKSDIIVLKQMVSFHIGSDINAWVFKYETQEISFVGFGKERFFSLWKKNEKNKHYIST